MGSAPTDFIFPLLFREKHKKENNVLASVRAGHVNGYDSLLLSTTVVRGEGRPRDPCYDVGESQLTDSQTYILLVI